jgi:hypothetical protein
MIGDLVKHFFYEFSEHKYTKLLAILFVYSILGSGYRVQGTGKIE